MFHLHQGWQRNCCFANRWRSRVILGKSPFYLMKTAENGWLSSSSRAPTVHWVYWRVIFFHYFPISYTIGTQRKKNFKDRSTCSFWTFLAWIWLCAPWRGGALALSTAWPPWSRCNWRLLISEIVLAPRWSPSSSWLEVLNSPPSQLLPLHAAAERFCTLSVLSTFVIFCVICMFVWSEVWTETLPVWKAAWFWRSTASIPGVF